MRRALLLLLVCGSACDRQADLRLALRFPDDRRLLTSVASVTMTATRDEVVLATTSSADPSAAIDLSGVSYGARTVIDLDGLDTSGRLVARGRTCPLDFSTSSGQASLYFSPVNFFAPTVNSPNAVRDEGVAAALSDGSVLLAGGRDLGGGLLVDADLFSPGAATFGASPAILAQGRAAAEVAALPSIGLLVTGGVDASGAAVAGGELYLESQAQFASVTDPRLEGRVGHRAVVLADGRVFLSGGRGGLAAGSPLSTSLLVYVGSDGSYQVTVGPPLAEARRDHAAVVAVGVPLLLGGYGASGAPIDSIEAIELGRGDAAPVIAHLAQARAEATASLLDDGSVLVVGGVDASGMPLATAEVWNPVTRTTTSFDMSVARRGHTVTTLVGGRVLVTGGRDATGTKLSSVELFAPGSGFVNERAMGTARAGHRAVSLCDGTVLITGGSGAADAELYAPPAS